MCLSVYLSVCLSIYLTIGLSDYLIYLSVCRSVCLSVRRSVRPSAVRPSVFLKEGILPDFLEKWQVTDPVRNPPISELADVKKKQFCEISSILIVNVKNDCMESCVQSEWPCTNGFAIFHPISLRLPRQREARSYEVLHLSCKATSANLKIRCSKLQPSLRKSLAWPTNISDKNVSSTARATRNAALQVIEKLFTVHEMDWNRHFLWSANLANSRPLRPLVDTFDIVSAGGKDLRPRRPSPVSIKIAVLMDAHLPIFWPYGWRYIPTCQKFTWETSWKCDIILPRFFISTWVDPPWFSPGEGYKTSLLSLETNASRSAKLAATFTAAQLLMLTVLMPAIGFATAAIPTRWAHFSEGAESLAPATKQDS